MNRLELEGFDHRAYAKTTRRGLRSKIFQIRDTQKKLQLPRTKNGMGVFVGRGICERCGGRRFSGKEAENFFQPRGLVSAYRIFAMFHPVSRTGFALNF